MTKSYTDDLAAWVKKKEKTRSRQDKGLVAFIAVKEDIAEAIEAGYALKTIWEHMREIGKIPYRYETFLKHVKRHIKPERRPVKKTRKTDSVQEVNNSPVKKHLESQGQGKPEGFNYDSEPKKEDLL